VSYCSRAPVRRAVLKGDVLTPARKPSVERSAQAKILGNAVTPAWTADITQPNLGLSQDGGTCHERMSETSVPGGDRSRRETLSGNGQLRAAHARTCEV
jgi:hypothetical protein